MWRCDDLEEEEEMLHAFLMHSHWGFVFCVLGGKYVRGPREREGEGEGGSFAE